MENQATPQPRDSRMEQFATTARHIIIAERGLTATALMKISSLAKQQHLSNEQVELCLSQISDGDSSLGRVGRYEQLFLDRMATDLPAISNAQASGVLSPSVERQAIQIAVDEFQISETRANQLLSFSAKQYGLSQVSATDAKVKLRQWIANQPNWRESQPTDLRSQISGLAERFGINAAEVDELIEAEIISRKKQRSLKTRGLFCGVLAAASLAVAGLALGPHLRSWVPDDPTVLENTASKSDLESSSPVENKQVLENTRTTGRPDQPQNPELVVDEYNLLLDEIFDDGSVRELGQWHQRLVEIANPPLNNLDPKSTKASLAVRRKKNEAIAALQTKDTSGRTQIRGLEDLSDLTESLTDITAAEAKVLALFCLQSDSAELQLAVQRKIDRFGQWPQFLLAISDQLAKQIQPPSGQQWKRRIALLLTKRNLPRDSRLSETIFSIAGLRLQENALSQRQRDKTELMKSEQSLANLVGRFISFELTDPSDQQYFHRLINYRDLTAMSMQRRLELQQILIEAILLADADTEQSIIAEPYFRNIQTANTIGQQLIQSRQAMLKISAMYLAKRQQSKELIGLQVFKTQPLVTVEEASQLRDRAELAVLSAEQSQMANAVMDYRRAASCSDSGIARSSLRGLIAITKDPQEKQRYRRQFDFVAGGQMGPCDNLFTTKLVAETGPELQEVIALCQKLRRGELIEPQMRDAFGNASDDWPMPSKTLWTVLSSILERPYPISMSDLALVVEIESAVKLAVENSEEARFELQLPWRMQALLPPIELNPLMPLQ